MLVACVCRVCVRRKAHHVGRVCVVGMCATKNSPVVLFVGRNAVWINLGRGSRFLLGLVHSEENSATLSPLSDVSLSRNRKRQLPFAQNKRTSVSHRPCLHPRLGSWSWRTHRFLKQEANIGTPSHTHTHTHTRTHDINKDNKCCRPPSRYWPSLLLPAKEPRHL